MDGCIPLDHASLEMQLPPIPMPPFLTMPQLLALPSPEGPAHRIAFDIVRPRPSVYHRCEVRVGEYDNAHPEWHICDISDPLIDQFIALKPFLVPENMAFFVEYFALLEQRLRQPGGLDMAFVDSTRAGAWFAQQLPTMDPKGDPLDAALQLAPLFMNGQ